MIGKNTSFPHNNPNKVLNPGASALTSYTIVPPIYVLEIGGKVTGFYWIKLKVHN